jgi:hypothetical protein
VKLFTPTTRSGITIKRSVDVQLPGFDSPDRPTPRQSAFNRPLPYRGILEKLFGDVSATGTHACSAAAAIDAAETLENDENPPIDSTLDLLRTSLTPEDVFLDSSNAKFPSDLMTPGARHRRREARVSALLSFYDLIRS